MLPIIINLLASMGYTCTCSTKNVFTLVCLCICLLFIVKDVKGTDDYHEVIKVYTLLRPGQTLCPFYATSCKRDSQVCSVRERLCVDNTLFLESATDREKWQKCRQYIIEHENKTQDLGPDSYYDVCLYNIGKLAMRYMTDWWSEMPESSEDASPASCFLPNNSCVKREEFCTDKGCQPLFPNKIKSDEEKRKYCQSVVLSQPVSVSIIERALSIKSTVSTEETDACYHVLGVLSMQDQKGGEKECPNVVPYQITVAVLAAVLVCILTRFVYHKVKQCRNCDNPRRQGQGIEMVPRGNPEEDNIIDRQNAKNTGRWKFRNPFYKEENRQEQNGEAQPINE